MGAGKKSRGKEEILRDLVRRGQSVLVGFDFPYGYPSGFAAALRLKDTPAWLAVWREITSTVTDLDDNRNNRFAAAAGFNLRISERGYPFWGCPPSCECSTLSSTKGGPLRFAPFMFASRKFAPVRSAPPKSAPLRSARLRSESLRSAPLRLAATRLTMCSVAPCGLVPISFTGPPSLPPRFARLKFAPLRSASFKFGRTSA